ncbi:MAG: DNA-binding response regulator [Ahrensia sp.]|nr:DNA-binding response regulator [Ahrensia sp.]
MRILLAEDDPVIASHVIEALGREGYVVERTSSGPETWEKGDLGTYDAVILDLGLPELDGLTLLRRWRRGGNMVPVLILTARGSWMERVDGFDAGADDYLPKPFRNEELLARLKALLRRAGSTPATAGAGRFRHDETRRMIFFDGDPVELSPQEYRAMVMLMADPDAVVSAYDLARHVQGRDDDSAKNAVEAMIKRIRRKTASDAILTRRGFGYTLGQTQA